MERSDFRGRYDERNPILIGIALGMALFLFAPIAAMMFFPKEFILPTFIGIGIDILFLMVGLQIF